MTVAEGAEGTTSLSVYDDALPLPDLRGARDRFAELRARRATSTTVDIRDVVLVVSSSRGGSTMLATLLRSCPDLLHLRGEMNPHVTIARLSNDPLTTLQDEIGVEIGRPGGTVDVDAVLWRLVAQWPTLDLDLAPLRAELDGVHDPSTIVRIARRYEPRIDPAYYDLPGVGRARGPHAPAIVEMAPFVPVAPWTPASADERAELPLVVTTPRNAFRFDLVPRLFPSARVRVVHLTRNPAASVNGLLDGWRHHGFFSTTTPFPSRPWWSFDPLPDWERWADAPLPDVCAEQWRAAHAAVLDASVSIDVHRLSFEDIAAGGDRRRQALCTLADWLGVPSLGTLAGVDVPPVMATEKPAPGRWRRRGREVLAAVRRPAVQELAATLGYEDPARWL